MERHSHVRHMSSKAVTIRLQELALSNFRCHEQASWSLHKGVNILLGDNGCGKTSVLEAASLMAHGRSFRQGRDPALVRWDCASFSVRGVWHRYGPLHIQLQGKRNQLQAFLQGQRVAIRKDLTEILPLVVDAPQARSLIDGVTADRRRWLDQLLIACEPSVQQHRSAYLRVLMQRGRLLRRHAQAEELDVWELQMTQYGQKWMAARLRLCQALNEQLNNEQTLTERHLQLRMHSTVTADATQWLAQLRAGRVDDRRLGRCRTGPHADRLLIETAGREIRSVGSRGQQKLAAVAIKLAECAVRQQTRGVWPVLLLDDCLEALDHARQQRLLRRLCDYAGQVLLTTPSDVEVNGLPVHTLTLASNG